MKLLLIVNRKPYDGTDATWNALRLVQTWLSTGRNAHIFLINDGVELARSDLSPPAGYFNLGEMLIETKSLGAEIKLCQTCIDRCGIAANQVSGDIEISNMTAFADWIATSDKIISI